ncbi:MAG TPA: glycosyltransferase family 39 protein [Blastocatellia bacterium]|nr:glycosyltransferase family 39 protein [Blastocatellia bacterium]
MSLALAGSLVVTALLGYPVASFLLAVRGAGSNSSWLKLWFSVGIGLGVASVIFFLCTLATGSVNKKFIIVEALAVIALFAVRARIKTHSQREASQRFSIRALFRDHPLLMSLFCGSLVLQVFVWVLLTLQSPHGWWDAWGFWNMRARFIFRAGTRWKETFSAVETIHGDYPAFMQTSIDRMWSYVGGETLAAPALLAFVFTFATVGLLVTTLAALRGRGQGLMGGLFLLSTPLFIRHGAIQFADVPVGFFMLAAVAALNLADENSGNRGLLAMAGVLASLAAWTKNEGLVFLIVLCFCYWLVDAIQQRRLPSMSGPLMFVAGALPVLLVLIYFKTKLATPNELVAAQGRDTIVKLKTFSRYITIGEAFVEQAVRVKSIPLLVLPVYACFVGVEWSQIRRPAVGGTLLALCLMLMGYFAVFLTTPVDLHLHLSGSLNRLLLQLWPTTLLLFFMVTRKEVLSAEY